MKKNRNALLLGTFHMTAAERLKGRFMRAPDHPAGDTGGTGTQGGDTNNQTGNTGDSGTGDKTQNNDGPAFTAEGFWKEPEPKAEEKKTPGSEDEPNPDDFGKTFAARIDGLKFDDVFTTEIADQIADGKLEGINERVTSAMRASVKQSTVLNAQLMQQFGTHLLNQVRTLIDGKFDNTKNEETLLEAFPSARDPAARPLIQSVFDQSMKHSGGDRKKAIAMTKDMLKLVGKGASSDFGIEEAPGSRGDFLGDGPSALVEELIGRK